MPRTTRADNKTRPTQQHVDEFIAGIEHAGRREDARQMLALMGEVTGLPPVMWGSSLIGFGRYHYVYDSGREGDLFLVGFSPRKANMVVYIMPGFDGYEALLKQLGKYRTGKSCLYLGRLSGVNQAALRKLVKASYEHMHNKYAVRE